MKIYCPPDNHKLAKLLFTAKLYGQTIAHETIPYNHKNKQFQEHHSLFSIPTLETEDANFLFGTHSILRKLAAKPTTSFQEAEINQWLQLVERDMEPSVGVMILKTNELVQLKEQQVNKAKDSLVKVIKTVDDRLKTNTFLVGNHLTIADISLFFSWNQIRVTLQKESKQLTNLHRWSKHISLINIK